MVYFGQFKKGELRDKKLVEFSIKSRRSLSRQGMLTFLCCYYDASIYSMLSNRNNSRMCSSIKHMGGFTGRPSEPRQPFFCEISYYCQRILSKINSIYIRASVPAAPF